MYGRCVYLTMTESKSEALFPCGSYQRKPDIGAQFCDKLLRDR